MPKLVCIVRTCEAIPHKDNLKNCEVDIGEDELITVVTNAKNVREGSRVIVATIGTEIEVNGEVIEIKRTNVGGVYSSGMFMDSLMLGWQGGAVGLAAQVPDSFKPGDAAPSSKPRMDGGTIESSKPALTDKELKAKEKEEKKAILKAKKEKRLAEKSIGKKEQQEDVSDILDDLNIASKDNDGDLEDADAK